MNGISECPYKQNPREPPVRSLLSMNQEVGPDQTMNLLAP